MNIFFLSFSPLSLIQSRRKKLIIYHRHSPNWEMRKHDSKILKKVSYVWFGLLHMKNHSLFKLIILCTFFYLHLFWIWAGLSVRRLSLPLQINYSLHIFLLTSVLNLSRPFSTASVTHHENFFYFLFIFLQHCCIYFDRIRIRSRIDVICDRLYCLLKNGESAVYQARK